MQVDYIDHLGNDLLVVNSARVSFGKWKDQWDDADQRLLNYLAKHNHYTPFAQPQLTFRVTAPIFVSRQLEKHIAGLVMGTAIPLRNEISRRYVDSEPVFYIPESWRGRAENVKQGSGERLNDMKNHLAHTVYLDAITQCQLAYDALLEAGVAPEQARMVLPQSTETTWIWTGSLAAYHRVCTLRLDTHAQSETREVAQHIAIICSQYFPFSWKALNDHV